MQETIEDLKKWLNQMEKYKTPRIDSLPDLGLYMDQVISSLDKILDPITVNEKLITSSMINNYVKGLVIPNPISKKYTRIHLIYIIALCSLKNVLPLSEINKLLPLKDDVGESFFMYDDFRIAQDEALHGISQNVLEKINTENFISDENDLYNLALKLAINSFSTKLVSEKIIHLLNEKKEKEIEEIKKKTQIQPSINA